MSTSITANEGNFGAQCSSSVGLMNSLVTLLVQSIYTAQCNIAPPESWPPDYAETALKKGLQSFDFVIVGAGTAGSIVASRLSENPKLNVLLLEAGGDPPKESAVPSLFGNLQYTEFSYAYFMERNNRSCMAYKNEQCHCPRGKMLGGTGSLNGMLYVRGNRFDYDRWQAEGNIGWGFNEVWSYFERSLNPVGNDTHPEGYAIVNEFPRFNYDLFDMILKGSKELGIPNVKEFAEGSYVGYGYIKGNIKNGERANTGTSYLAKVGHRPNLKVIKNAQVTKINFDRSGKSVKSLKFNLENKTLTVNIKQEAILSAGTIDSAKLLMLSGVGPKQHLKSLNIPVVRDLAIGENFQDHMAVYVFMKLKGVPTDNKQTLDDIYRYLIQRQGPLSTHSAASLAGFINTQDIGNSKKSLYPNISFYHFILRMGNSMGLEVTLNNMNLKEELKIKLRQTILTNDILLYHINLAHPKSKGHIKLKSSSYHDDPLINANYMSEPEDVDVVVEALKYLDKLAQTQAFQQKEADFIHIHLKECDQYAFKSVQYWRCYVKYFSSAGNHYVGTVKMGPKTDAKACVDPRLKVKGVKNLRVIDASIMPYVTSGNPNAPITMIAEKGVDFIREDCLNNEKLTGK